MVRTAGGTSFGHLDVICGEACAGNLKRLGVYPQITQISSQSVWSVNAARLDTLKARLLEYPVFFCAKSETVYIQKELF